MPTVSVELDRDLHVKVKKYAEGIGVELGELVASALKYALSSRYPDNSLPGGSGGRPDQGLPGEQPGIDNSLPRPPFDPSIDNELPEGEIPPEIDNSLPGYQPRPDQGLPGGSGGRPDQTLPGGGARPDQDCHSRELTLTLIPMSILTSRDHDQLLTSVKPRAGGGHIHARHPHRLFAPAPPAGRGTRRKSSACRPRHRSTTSAFGKVCRRGHLATRRISAPCSEFDRNGRREAFTHGGVTINGAG